MLNTPRVQFQEHAQSLGGGVQGISVNQRISWPADMAHVGRVVSTTQTRNIPQWDAELHSQGRVWVGGIPSLVGCEWNLSILPRN